MQEKFKKQTNEIEEYEEAVAYLEAIPQFMDGYGVDRSTLMLDALNRPEKSFSMIHVAGTNGKGSVCLYVHDILKNNGYRTGLFTSPHLTDIRERVRINGNMISKADFVTFFAAVKKADERLGGGKLAYFDYMLGIAVLAFQSYDVDFAVMETGLGGRLDSTNALQTPIASVITTISLEHTAILGSTVEMIAAEKAGIIKPDTIFVYLDGRNEKADAIIKARADECNCRCAFAYRKDIYNYKNSGNYIDFSVTNGYYSNACFRINTGAMYQLDNCLEALTVVGALHDEKIVNVTYENTAKALREAHWQGRMEQIRDGIYVDGAHNPEGVRSLTQSVPFIAKEKPAVLLFSAVSDKNVDEMARILSESGVFVKVYITQLEGSRKLDAATIREAFIRNKFTCCDVCDDYDEAFMKAVRAARRLDGVLFVSGSLYLVGDITRLCGGLN